MEKDMRILINTLYDQGVPISEIENIFKERAAEKKKANNLKVTKARKEMIAACVNYIEATNPDIKVSPKQLEDIEKDIINFEKFKTKVEKNDDIIMDFLKSLGVE